MNRREFIKACSLMAAAGLLFGCRKIPFVGETPSAPSLKRFQDEVKLALSKAKESLNLVRVNAPGPRYSAIVGL